MGPTLDNKVYLTTYNTTNPFYVDGSSVGFVPKNAVEMWLKDMPKSNSKTNFKEYEPKKIIYNGKATVVFWKDGTKTVVKMAEGTTYSKYNAFCAALAKKIFGSNSAVNRTVANGIEQK